VKTLVLLAAGLFGCATPPPDEAPPQTQPEKEAVEAPATAPARAPATGLPLEFEVKGDPVVEEPYLGAAATWRSLISRLTTLRADAGQTREDLLVTFESGALHATSRDGRRTTWRLPNGLRFSGEPRHLLLRSDTTMVLLTGDGVEVPMGEEVTVVRAIVRTIDGGEEEFRLVIKEGATFRSISNAG